jgi:hypothetical protein
MRSKGDAHAWPTYTMGLPVSSDLICNDRPVEGAPILQFVVDEGDLLRKQPLGPPINQSRGDTYHAN